MINLQSAPGEILKIAHAYNFMDKFYFNVDLNISRIYTRVLTLLHCNTVF